MQARDDEWFMGEALRLASRGCGRTSPNPMVGAVLVRRRLIIGRGWHRSAGLPHAEIEALRDAARQGHSPRNAELYVTLEPCCTHGRTPPCTDALVAAGVKKVVVGATDPNPKHAGRGFRVLRHAGIEVVIGVLGERCAQLNEAFNHWIVHRTPFVTVKAAMTLDGKIATASGESKWITSDTAHLEGMRLRKRNDAILVGINTVLADDPSLTFRGTSAAKPLRRIVLDSLARTPLKSKLISDEHANTTSIVVSKAAPVRRVEALAKRVSILRAPLAGSQIDLRWLLKRLGREHVTSLLVEGGGETHASFLRNGLAHRIVFFYAPKILGGRKALRAVSGAGARSWGDVLRLRNVEWHRIGPDLMLTACTNALNG